MRSVFGCAHCVIIRHVLFSVVSVVSVARESFQCVRAMEEVAEEEEVRKICLSCKRKATIPGNKAQF